MNKAERIEIIIQRFKSKQFTRATKRNKLESQIQSLFAKSLSQSELDDTIKGLTTMKILEIKPEGAVIYKI